MFIMTIAQHTNIPMEARKQIIHLWEYRPHSLVAYERCAVFAQSKNIHKNKIISLFREKTSQGHESSSDEPNEYEYSLILRSRLLLIVYLIISG